jgi:hypothetical protein
MQGIILSRTSPPEASDLLASCASLLPGGGPGRGAPGSAGNSSGCSTANMQSRNH